MARIGGFFSIILGDLKDLANELLSLLFISFLVYNNLLLFYFGFVLLGEYKLQGTESAPMFSPQCRQCVEEWLVYSRLSIKNLS